MEVTPIQREYLKAIEGEPKTTRAVAERVGTTRNNAWKLLDILRRKGLVDRFGTSQAYLYALKQSIDINTLGEKPPYSNGQSVISDEEKAFAKELRESKPVGQRLIDKYHERYPDRSKSGIRHVIDVIRREGCR